MLWNLALGVVREENPMRALLQCPFKLSKKLLAAILPSEQKLPYQRDDLCRLGHQFVGEVLIVCDQVYYVDVAVEFVQKRVVFELISVDEVVVDSEAENEGFELHLNLDTGIRTVVECRPEGLRCVYRSRVHGGVRLGL